MSYHIITLHYIAVHCIALHYITIYQDPLHFIHEHPFPDTTSLALEMPDL